MMPGCMGLVDIFYLILHFNGVPGFWRHASRRIRLWSEHDISDDLLLIPIRTERYNL